MSVASLGRHRRMVNARQLMNDDGKGYSTVIVIPQIPFTLILIICRCCW